jgi:ketosteroid isomerase-like protein
MRTIPFSIVLILVLGFHGVARASEPHGETEMTRGGADMARADEAAILQAVEGFAVGFINRDLEMVMDLWDASAADEVSFLQVENELPVIGLENFRAYYTGHLQNIITLGGEVSDVQIRRMGDIAYVVCRYTWVSKYVSTGQVSVDSTRATIILRKQGRRWLYQHFHESITFPV